MKCCFCGKEIEDYGNSSYPLYDKICCNDCNGKYVIRSRMMLLNHNKSQTHNKIICNYIDNKGLKTYSKYYDYGANNYHSKIVFCKQDIASYLNCNKENIEQATINDMVVFYDNTENNLNIPGNNFLEKLTGIECNFKSKILVVWKGYL